jgi:hypothetical protein
MAKILSGGYAYENNFLPNKQESMPTPLAPAEPEQAPESWGEWGARNIAKAPAKWWEMARSGLGAGNIVNALSENIPAELRNTPIPMPGTIGMQPGGGLGALRRGLLPTTEEAGQELAAFGVPSYYRESRQGDVVPEFVLGELPFWLAGGAFKSVSRLLGAAGQSAAMGLGSAGLGAAGEELGETLNLPEPLKKTLGIAGGIIGGIGGQRVLSHALNRPSKILPGQVYKKEEGLFEAEKAGKLEAAEAERMAKSKSLEKEYAQGLRETEAETTAKIKSAESEKISAIKNAIKERKTQIRGIEKEFDPQVARLEKERRKAELALPKDRAAFDKQKKGFINEIKEEASDYSKTMNKLNAERNKNYKEAKKYEAGQKGSTDILRTKLKEIEKNIKGVNKEDEAEIFRAIDQVREEGKNMTLEDAKTMHKNFNAQIYKYKASPTFKDYMRRINHEVGEFVRENGGEEHYKYWVPAEEASAQYSKMKNNQEDFIANKNQEIKEIKNQTYSLEKEGLLKQESRVAKENLARTQKEYKGALKTTEKEHEAALKATTIEHKAAIKKTEAEHATNIKAKTAAYKDALKSTDADVNAIIKAIGKESFEDVLKSRDKTSKLTTLLADSLGVEGANRVTQWGAAGALAALGGFFGHLAGHGFIGATAGLLAKTGHTIFNEIKIARSVMKKHPELYKEYADIIKQFETLPKATILKNLDLMGYKIEQAQKEEKNEKPQEGKRIGGSRIISGGMI